MKNGALWILVLIGVALCAVGAYAWVQAPKTDENAVPVATSTVDGSASSSVNTYRNTAEGFSFSYSTSYSEASATDIKKQPWSALSSASGVRFVQVNVPKSSEFVRTNFSDAQFSVGKTSDQSEVDGCIVYRKGDGETIETETINGVKFAKLTTSDAAAGNRYETTSYRTVRNNDCYAIEYTIHSTNIGNYSPDQGITEFNKAEVVKNLESIVQTFRFDELANRSVSLDGTFECLPHRNPGQVQTMECAFGMRTDAGTHYALDLQKVGTDGIVDAPTGARIRVSGVVVPIEAISSNTWQKYDIVGIMSAETFAQL